MKSGTNSKFEFQLIQTVGIIRIIKKRIIDFDYQNKEKKNDTQRRIGHGKGKWSKNSRFKIYGLSGALAAL
jgi:hypothetical protein